MRETIYRDFFRGYGLPEDLQRSIRIRSNEDGRNELKKLNEKQIAIVTYAFKFSNSINRPRMPRPDRAYVSSIIGQIRQSLERAGIEILNVPIGFTSQMDGRPLPLGQSVTKVILCVPLTRDEKAHAIVRSFEPLSPELIEKPSIRLYMDKCTR